jgi:4-diphosphocytidyl-2-C-methyl-D-erythritol kinase
MTAWIAHCPAKVNLGLKVIGRRRDGFHEIVTLFQTIDLWDTLEAGAAETLSLEVTPPGSAPGDASNLVLRATRRLRERLPPPALLGARLRLVKRIPAGGGLGGGSSNAAAALLLLDRLWNTAVGAEELAVIGGALGSDVPFFLRGGTALGTGRGDQVRPLAPMVERPILLGVPPYELATAAVYAALAAPLTPRDAGVKVSRLFVNFAERNDFARITNDLETPAFGMRSGLAPFRDALVSLGADVALLSGSGSSVFGMFPAGTDLGPAASQLRRLFPDWTLHASRTVASGVRIEPAEGEGCEGGFGSAST